MELKPIKENKKALYPTISESKKNKRMKNILLAAGALDINAFQSEIYIAVPVYAPVYMPLKVFRTIRNVTFLTTVIFLFLLIKNKIKMKKSTNQKEETTKKIKKHIKIDWWLLIISIVVMLIAIGAIIYIHYM